MELRPGYTMTELGVLPEDWEVRPLGELGILIKGKGITRSEALSGVLPCIRYGEIYTHHNFVVKDFISFISRDVAEKSMRLECGDILFTCSGETKEDIGKCVSFIFSIEAYAGGDIIILRNASEDAVFLGYRLNAFDIVQQKSSLGQGDAVVHISQKALSSILVSFPKALPEQHAIAAALSDVDALLDAQERLIAKKRNIKLAAMQQLLTGKTRLPGYTDEWVTKNIGEIAIINPESLSQTTSPNYTFKYISLEDVSKGVLLNYTIQSFSKSPSRARRIIKNKDILIGTVRPNLMSHLLINFTDIDFICSTGFCVLRCSNEVIPEYVFQLFFEKNILSQIDLLVTGSNYPAISSTDIAKLTISLPNDSDEQRAIAAVLSDMDAELAALEARRDKLRAVKQGMMRELLTGRTRLAGAGGQHGR